MAGGMGKSTPAAPDFTQAALQTALMGREGMREQTYANRPNINTPWGSYSWSVTPGQGNPYGMAGGGTSGAAAPPESGGGNSGPVRGGLLPASAAAGVGGLGAIPIANQLFPGGPASGVRVVNPAFDDGKMSAPGASGPGSPYYGTPGSLPEGTGGTGGDPYGFTPEQWSLDVNLSPEQQAIFDQQQEIQGQRGELAGTLLGSASDVLGQQADWSSLPEVGNGMDARNRAEDAIYGRLSNRLDPMWSQREDQTRTRLYNQGLREGDAAFDQAMGNFGRERGDAYENAMLSSITGGGQEMTRQFGQEMQGRQQGISEMLGERSSTLNELQALLSGQQVQMPGQPSFMGAGAAQAPNMLGAAQSQYGAGLDAFNAQQMGTQGLMGGLAALAPYAYMLSDARLKTNIRYLDAEAIPGVKWATWEWKAGGKGRGVIAQDVARVRPDLVLRGEDGFLRVNYDAIGGAP